MSKLEENINHINRENEILEQQKLESNIYLTSPNSVVSLDDEERPIKTKQPKIKPPKSEDEVINEPKAPRLPSTEEIYNRIKWDCASLCDIDDFTIVYEDRFVGLMETPFTGYEFGSIPLHRIQSFKYKDNLIYDRATRFIDFPEFTD